MNPGITSPIPFSTQMATKRTRQAGMSQRGSRRRGWMVRITVATTLMAMAVQIQGTRALCPSRPKKRYWR
jgi:hypothetical protein